MDELKMCFACGTDNPIGLKLDFKLEGDQVTAYFVPTETHQGYPGMMHGGLVTTLLDEAMAKVLNLQQIVAVTATIDVKFRHIVPIGERLTISGQLVKEGKRRCLLKSYVTNQAGKILAQASSVFIKLGDKSKEDKDE